MNLKKKLIELEVIFNALYIPEPNSGCWLWLGSIDAFNYGRLQYRGKREGAHRISYRLHKGDLGNLQVLHRCDNPICVNPEHLFLGTVQDNVNDMIKKGRMYDRRGVNNSRARFTLEEINVILNDTRLQYEIAAEYGVSQSTISRIKRNEVYTL